MKKRLILVITSEEEINKAKEIFEKKYESSHEELKAINNFDFRYYTSTEEAKPFFSQAFSIVTMLETTKISMFWCPRFKDNRAELLITYPNLADVMFFSPHTETFPHSPGAWGKTFRKYTNFNSRFCTTSGDFGFKTDSNFWHAVWKSLFTYIKDM